MRQIILITLTAGCFLTFRGQPSLWAQALSQVNLGAGITTMFTDTVSNMLYIGGDFDYIDGKKCRGAARWDGTQWDSMSVGFDINNEPAGFANNVWKILKYKGKIYYFGNFTMAGNYHTNGMAVWNGTSWDSVAYFTGLVRDADVFNDTLYICGVFSKVGNVLTDNVAKFDGTNWYAMSFPYPQDTGPVFHIRGYKNKVYVAGAFYSHGFSMIAEYTQASGWKPSVGVQGDVYKSIDGIERIDTLLYFYGHFTHLSTVYSPCLAAYSGNQIFGFPPAFGTNNTPTIYNAKKINGKIYAVGYFSQAGGMTFPGNLGIAELDGNAFCIYGQAFDNIPLAIEKYGNDTFIGGGFWTINGDSVKKVAKWIGGNYTYSCTTFTTTVANVGLKENSEILKAISVYPNPSKGVFSIRLPEGLSKNEIVLTVTDQLGREINVSKGFAEIDLSDFAAGIYFLKLQTDQGQKSFKLIRD